MSYGLGKGLSSLIPQKTNKESTRSVIREDEYHVPTLTSDGKGFFEVEVERIDPNPRQPRKSFNDIDISELAQSLKDYGVIQPLVLTKKGERYELIAGERRLRAAKMADLKKVPVVVRDYDEQKKLEVALVENIQRSDLNPMEKAMAYRQLMDDFNLTVEETARRVGKSRPQVSNTIRLMALPEEICNALSHGQLTEAHAIYLIGIDNPVRQMDIFRKIIQNNWTVKETGRQVRRFGGTKESRIKEDPADRGRSAAFRTFFAARVEIKRENRGGKVIIDFMTNDELDEMVKKIKS